LFSLYRRLVWARKRSVALRRGTYRSIRAPRGVFAYAREAEGEQVLVALNFTGSPLRVALGSGSARVVVATDHGRGGDSVELERVDLSPDAGETSRAEQRT